MSAICDAHKKNVGVEQLYNCAQEVLSVGDQTSWS